MDAVRLGWLRNKREHTDTHREAMIMTGTVAMRAKTDMNPQGLLGSERTARIPGDPSSRSYYKDKGPAIFR